MNLYSSLAPSLLAALLVAGPVAAQLVPEAQTPIQGARQPALSPDGRTLVFVYRGDLWVAPSAGGRATPLTSHVDADAHPMFSPDGRWVAFASRRNGNLDIFAVPAEGGAARQLTWHGGSDIPLGWTPDGRQIFFSGKRDAGHQQLFALDTTNLRTELLAEDYAPMGSASASPDGRQVAYGRYGFHWTRPRYQGSAAQQIWLLERATGRRRALTTNEFQHLWTRFLPDGKHLVTVTVAEGTPSSSPLRETVEPFLDSAARTPNLWRLPADGKGAPKALTTFIGGAVRSPSVAARSGDIAFEYGPDLWLLRGNRKPEPIRLLVASDEKQTTRRRERLTTGVTEAELSPDGKTFAFGLRGEIWTIPTQKPRGVAGRGSEFARRLTDWEGDDSDFFWSPDNSRLYFTSDREFTTRLYEMELSTLKTRLLWNRDENITRINVSPDGRQLAFWVAGPEGGLYVLPVDGSGEPRRVIHLPGSHWRGGGGDYAWSPDLKWIAYSARSESRAYNIFVIRADGTGQPINVTRLYASHSNPAWSPDGRYLYFQSDREGSGLYVLPLQPEAVRASDTDLKFERPGTNLVVQIDFTDISRRIRRLSSQTPQGDLTVTPDGTLVFLSEGDVWTVSYDGKETKRATTGGGKQALRVSRDGKRISFLQGGDMFVGALGAPAEKIAFVAEWERDVRAERKAAFTQFWNAYHRAFYDPNFHGRDWAAIRDRYAPLLDSVETSDEFASLLHMMIGELEASHSEVSPAPGPGGGPVTPHLGLTFDYRHPGPGLRVKTVPPGAPGSYKKTEIRPGEYILGINGRDVALDERLYQAINDKQDREFEFLVSTNTDRRGARTVRYKVLATDEWDDLLYRNRSDRLRNYVEERSGGRIGYVHIAAMGAGNQIKFEREAYEYMAGKEALIIDVRFNRGGNIADTLIDWIERKPHGWNRPRDAAPETVPYRAWEKKCVVLMNEHSYSNGEIFPNAMRARGLATLIGMPTPGYVIWTMELRLVDGTGARMPMSGAYRLDGTNLENNGEQPDLRVPLSPEDWLSDRDPQLDRAIEQVIGRPGAPARSLAGEDAADPGQAGRAPRP
jgi:tricorn protease